MAALAKLAFGPACGRSNSNTATGSHESCAAPPLQQFWPPPRLPRTSMPSAGVARGAAGASTGSGDAARRRLVRGHPRTFLTVETVRAMSSPASTPCAQQSNAASSPWSQRRTGASSRTRRRTRTHCRGRGRRSATCSMRPWAKSSRGDPPGGGETPRRGPARPQWERLAHARAAWALVKAAEHGFLYDIVVRLR